MKNKLYVFGLLWCLPLWIMAQDSSRTSADYYILKYAPSSLFNFVYPAVQFGFEHKIGERTAMQYELGGMFLNNSELYSLEGEAYVFKALAEHRWYKSPFGKGKNKFQGVGFRFRQQIKPEAFFRSDQLFGTDYYPNTDFLLRLTQVRTSVGFYYTRGVQRRYDTGMTLELGAAAGLQYNHIAARNAPDGFDFNRPYLLFEGFSPFWSSSLFPQISFFILKVGYDLKQR